jgi:uncharacterized paraquat-inducible protein A
VIKYSAEFFKKSFVADTMKNAYLKAAKWYAINILSKAEFANVHVKYEKDNESESPTIIMRLFAYQDGEKDVMEHHCKCCKEMHASFFINEDTHCNRCSALGYQNRLEQKISIKKSYYREKLTRNLEE